MKVNKADSAAIILTIFDELQTPAGGKIQLTTLEDKWAAVGLRMADLEAGLESLLSKEILETSYVGDAACYILTKAGYAHMTSLNSPLTFGLASYQRLRRNSEKRMEIPHPAATGGFVDRRHPGKHF